MVDAVPVLGITVILYAVSEILKRTALKNNADLKAIIPYFCAIVGAVAAAVMFAIDPSLLPDASNVLDAVVMGAASGLIATGANQVYKQFYNLIAIGKSTAEDIDKEVANMTTEEKKDYLTDVAADAVMDVLNKVGHTENGDNVEANSSNANTASIEEDNKTSEKFILDTPMNYSNTATEDDKNTSV